MESDVCHALLARFSFFIKQEHACKIEISLHSLCVNQKVQLFYWIVLNSSSMAVFTSDATGNEAKRSMRSLLITSSMRSDNNRL